MRPLTPTLLSTIVALCVMAAAGTARGAEMIWPVPPSRLSLDTPYGTLSVKASDYVYESVLLFDDKPVDPKIEGIVNITYAFATPTSQVALVSVNKGSYECPVTYRWITIDKDGYTVSPSFGSCSKQIKVFVTGRKLTMETPDAQKPDEVDVYVYDGKTIQHHTKR
jgi:hypothetical protein